MKTNTISCHDKLKNLSVFLKELRINFGYTQDEVTMESNMHRNTLIRIENGHNFTIKHLLKLAEYYGIPAHELLQEVE